MQYVEQFQKPKRKRQKRAKNNPKPTEFDTCFVCGHRYAQTHEVFGGNTRQKSIKHKMQIKLCERHHTGAEGIHSDTRFNFKVKQIYQRRFEEQYGHELFMQEFGKDYLALTYEEFIKKGCVA